MNAIKTVGCEESLKYIDCRDMNLPPEERTQITKKLMLLQMLQKLPVQIAATDPLKPAM
ncbi:hypothetical protein FACS1894130_01270 [Spirochaetia bacterium]|nr:hypothetical protein FACS1894130_01270 [Spirochaetia bacterium]